MARQPAFPWPYLLLAVACGAIGYFIGAERPPSMPEPQERYYWTGGPWDTVPMEDAAGRRREVQAPTAYTRFVGGKLRPMEQASYQATDSETGAVQQFTGEQLGQVWRAEKRAGRTRSKWLLKGVPHEAQPPGLAPPDELLP